MIALSSVQRAIQTSPLAFHDPSCNHSFNGRADLDPEKLGEALNQKRVPVGYLREGKTIEGMGSTAPGELRLCGTWRECAS